MSSGAMNALVLHAVGDARYETIPLPEPKAGQVRVRVAFCGVCNSDIPRFFGQGPHSLPLVCGHEFSGVIDRVGPEVAQFSPGDRVAVFPLLWCGSCCSCESGLYAQCLNYDYLGSRSNGAFADYVVAPARNLLRVSDDLSLEEAAMIEPAAVALHALRRAGGCAVRESVAVFGAGPIGLMVAQWARAMGAAKVILVDLAPEKLALAHDSGFRHLIDLRYADPVSTIEGLTGGLGAHVCVDAAGVPQATVQCLSSTRYGGRAVLLGNPSGEVIIPAGLISRVMRREITIVGTWNSEFSAFGEDDDWHRSLAGIGCGVIDVKPLITHRVPLEEALSALHMIKERSGFYCKVLIRPNRGEGQV